MIRNWYNQIPYPALKTKREITKYINWRQFTKGTRGKQNEQLFPKYFYQYIPLSSRDKAIFTFSEFEPRQRLGQSQMTFDNLLGYILSISLSMQNFIKIFQTV